MLTRATCRSPVPARLIAVVLCLAATAQAGGQARTYRLYEPEVTWRTVYRGRLAEGEWAYNHCPSVAHFDGRFYVVWNGHPRTHLEGKPGQMLLLATSEDFVQWSRPVHFVGPGAANPLADPEGVQWQPNLLNFHGRELWCTWFFHTLRGKVSGTYCSKLGRGPEARWRNDQIFHRYRVEGLPFVGFATQNPVLLDSGRVLAPVTFYRRFSPTKRVHWNACLYTDDAGRTWQCSNPIGLPQEHDAQWEPFFYEQADGRLRAFMRNMTRATPACTQWQLTCTGAGRAEGEPVRFDPDPHFSHIETANSRTQVFPVRGGRYCMLQHDVFVEHRGYETRLNLALYFSRTGADDFVAGPPFSPRNAICAYPQGIAHEGKIYVAYTRGPGSGPRSIEAAIIDPAPEPDQFYLWPREKDWLRMATQTDGQGHKRVVRTNPKYRPTRPHVVATDGRRAILFKRAGSAGVEIDPVDFHAGQTLALRFDVKIAAVQERGKLVLCSFGDRMPIRLVVPGHRVGQLYVDAGGRPRLVGPLPVGQWRRVEAVFGRDHYTVAVGDAAAKTFANPLPRMNPRLYLGDGYTVDYLPSNWGSEFLVDLSSVTTSVQ